MWSCEQVTKGGAEKKLGMECGQNTPLLTELGLDGLDERKGGTVQVERTDQVLEAGLRVLSSLQDFLVMNKSRPL